MEQTLGQIKQEVEKLKTENAKLRISVTRRNENIISYDSTEVPYQQEYYTDEEELNKDRKT